MENELLAAKDQEIENLKKEINKLKEDAGLTYWTTSMDKLHFDALTELIVFKDRTVELEDELFHSITSGEKISTENIEQFKDNLEYLIEHINEIEKKRALRYKSIFSYYSCLLTSSE